MQFIPHDYQAYCIDYIKTHPVAALFLSMGLGKTVITLSAIRDLMQADHNVSKVLVIAPLRVARDTWPAEVRKWDHLKELDISVIVGAKKDRVAAINRKSQIYIVNRENVQSLVEYHEKSGQRWPYDMVVIDELSSFKNHASKRFRALWKVRPYVQRWVGLTGTPTSNGLIDLWAEIGILDGGKRLGRYISNFQNMYFIPAARNPRTGVVYSYAPRYGAANMIYARIADMTISMKAMEYLPMPDCLYINHEVRMEPGERRLYDLMKEDLKIPLENGDINAVNAAALTSKLMQMANGAVYDERKETRLLHDQKLEKLEDLIESANGQTVLIAYWFKHDKDRIMQHLRSKGYDPREIKESRDIIDWNAGQIPIALIHPASAGHGLNIQSGGHILIWFGLTWSLELYQQTNARLWRQGQNEVVTIHHIITEGTVDEDVLRALESKDLTQEKLIAAVKAHIAA